MPKDNTNALQACLERIEQKLENIDSVNPYEVTSGHSCLGKSDSHW